MIHNEDYTRIINYATRAPSSHNTQPWRFRLTDDIIRLTPDLSRSLPVVDPENRALFISLGCAFENLVIAASHYGYSSEVSYAEYDMEIRVRLQRFEENNGDELFRFLKSRQVTRNLYQPEELPVEKMEALTGITTEPGTGLRLYSREEGIGRFLPLVTEAGILQFRNRQFVEELIRWSRYSRREAMQTGDGIWSATLGIPSAGRWLGSLIMKHLVTPASEEKRLSKQVVHSGGFALLLAEQDNHEHWIRTGRLYQRFGLTTTGMGIRHAHLNMPVEEPVTREKLAAEAGSGESIPMLLLRFGYSERMPYSFRRNLHDIIE